MSLKNMPNPASFQLPDRSVRPAVILQDLGKWSWPEPVGPEGAANLPGSPALLREGREPLLRIDLQWSHGLWQEPDFLAARVVARMLSEGTALRSASEWTGAMDYWGAQYQFSVEALRTVATLYVLDKHLSSVWPLWLEAVVQPALNEDSLQRVVQSKIQHWKIESEKVGFLAARRLRTMVYPAGHPESLLSTPEDYEALEPRALVRTHRALWMDRQPGISLCGPAAAEAWEFIATEGILDAGGAWQGCPPAARTTQWSGPAPAAGMVRIPKAGSLQVALRAALTMPPKTHPDYHGLKILVSVLGGYFGSRLMQNLREDKGMTYGVGASLRSFGDHGVMTVASEVMAGREDDALEQVRFEMERLRSERVTEAELNRVKSYLHGQWMAGLDGPFALMDRYWDLRHDGLGQDYLQDYLRALEGISPSALLDLAVRYLDPDAMVVVLAGSGPA